MLLAIAVWIWLHERTQATAQSRSLMADRRAPFDESSGVPNLQRLLSRVVCEVAAAAALAVLTLRIHRNAPLERALGSASVEVAMCTLAASLGGGRRFQPLALGRIDGDQIAVALAADGTLADAEMLTRRQFAEDAVVGLGEPISMRLDNAAGFTRETPATGLASACVTQYKAEAAGVRTVRIERELTRLAIAQLPIRAPQR